MSSTEPTFYPAVKMLLSEVLSSRGLLFDARVNTSERREGGGIDLPDLALYDGSSQFPIVSGEIKLPAVEIADMAISTAQNDQVGRYLARSRVVLLCNLRAFGLLTVSAEWTGQGPVPPSQRRLEQVVALWPSSAALLQAVKIDVAAFSDLGDLVEAAVTRFASIAEPESLARILAWQARQAKADLPERFSEAVHGLLDDFGRALGVTFEGKDGEEFFRSSLIQTAYYGLFAGWVLWHRAGGQGTFRWEDLSEYLKIPFLGELFHEFRHPARIRELRLAKHLDMATEALGRVVPEAFFARFGPPTIDQVDEDRRHAAASTAIMYFYEPFLEAFDPDLRKELGVWYTPSDIVSYQVRKIDRVLRDELHCDRGFADERVVVLDPCCGTGAYLLEVLRCIAKQLRDEGESPMLGAKLREAFCKRIIGFEILTAPFVISQLQLYLVLSEVGAAPEPNQRPAIFLTNALTGWHGRDQLKLNFPELQDEHDAAQAVKKDAKIIVILGNPPYNRFAGVPVEEEADLVDHYKGIRRDSRGRQIGTSELFSRWRVQKHLLDDLYIRFFRLAEARIGERAEFGVVSFISNYSYLAGRSHPLMRESLLKTFELLWIDVLNGDKYKTGKVIPAGLPGAGTSDQSVFTTEQDSRGIQVGTCIATLLKRPRPRGSDVARVSYREFWGRSSEKRNALVESLNMKEWSAGDIEAAAAKPEGPRAYLDFVPNEGNGWKLIPYSFVGGYEDWPALGEVFAVSYQGVNPNRGLEGSIVDTERETLESRMRDYFSRRSFDAFCRDHPVVCEPRARYEPENVRDKLRRISRFHDERIVDYLVFPLDRRFIYYEPEAKLLNERRRELWENLTRNEFLVAVPQPRKVSEARPLLTTDLFDLHVHDRGSVGFPAEVTIDGTAEDLFTSGTRETRIANLAESIWNNLRKRWQLSGTLGAATAKTTTRSLIRLALAVCHSPTYEAEHKDSLAHGWAHLPLPRDHALLEEAATLGGQVAALLDPGTDARRTIRVILGTRAGTLAVPVRSEGGPITERDFTLSRSYFGAAKGDWRPRSPGEIDGWNLAWGDATGDLFVNDSVFFKNVPARVWEYELGGYPVLKKWLGYRQSGRRGGRHLALAEVEHFRSMVQRLSAMLALGPAMNALYEKLSAASLSRGELGIE